MSAIERLEALAERLSQFRPKGFRGCCAKMICAEHAEWELVRGDLRAVIAEIKKRDEAVRKVAEEMLTTKFKILPPGTMLLEAWERPVQLDDWAARLRDALDG